ncbi:serine/threonine-protein phosphatase PGAM5 [Fistulifera solaris]|uniref:Serine/threonine-protein phosphatase PGAM5, mitochondrial n=1 Tax=Fistulifera solaris TaxID=1519565 RepID=A0A1Z5K1N1_FISSO|nr:serine/threonine-protein phosphatase PGAM5 [Fistulifera solaris]|eukprot:GAX20193.1 serine/threonine-protein phosphatase PGAM5 [Fistulifera solaris]
MHNAWRFVQHGRRTLSVSAASALGVQQYYQNCTTTFCGATDQDIPPIAGFQEGKESPATTSSYKSKVHEEWYHGMFPKRQLWRPKLEYPLWDPDWDHKHNDDLSSEEKRNLRVRGVTRHIILVRHGQYDESYRDDEKRVLTPLGREQAELTGQRLADMLQAQDPSMTCYISSLRVSNMTRAKETADIIAKYIQRVPYLEPDPDLNEGRPCHHIPSGGPATDKVIQVTDQNHPRIEQAFTKYFYRQSELPEEDAPQHEFEIIVCHANVIRYFLCRALQLPPETWLRFCPFNCSLTYLTIRPTGSVSCRFLGDIGHLPVSLQTFSNHHGFNW